MSAANPDAVRDKASEKRGLTSEEADLALLSIVTQRDKYSYKLDFVVADSEQHLSDFVLWLKTLKALDPDWFRGATICVLKGTMAEARFQNVVVTSASEDYFMPRSPPPLQELPKILSAAVLDGARHVATYNDYVAPGTVIASTKEFDMMLRSLKQGAYNVVEVVQW